MKTLLRIRKWSDAGLSLARIAELLTGADLSPPPRRAPGAIEVRTHVHLAEGLELVVTRTRPGSAPGSCAHWCARCSKPTPP